MAEENPSGGGPADAIRESARQFSELVERMRASSQAGMAAATGLLGPTGAQTQAMLSAMSAGAALPAAQLDALVQEIRARRDQVDVLRTQLAGFSDQLEALEAMLQPLAEWSRTWLRLQQAMVNPLGLATGGGTQSGDAAGTP
jgi:hypothetical protein